MSPAEQAIVAAAIRVVRAVDTTGPHPAYHRAVLEEVAHEWPTLWSAIQDLQAAARRGS